MAKNGNLIIGLTGLMGSGKGEAASLLRECGFSYLSLSDALREEIKRRGLVVDRITMQDVGNELRRRKGAAVLAGIIVGRIWDSPLRRWVVDGVRNPAEVLELRRDPGFVLLAVLADDETLIGRLEKRGRDTDKLSRDQIRMAIEREKGNGQDQNGQLVQDCIAMADIAVRNEGPLEELQAKLREILTRMEMKSEI
jgi:dephospho-CoA kinase